MDVSVRIYLICRQFTARVSLWTWTLHCVVIVVVPPPAPRSAHVHQFGVLYLLFTPVGTGGLLVNATYFSVPATDSQSLNPLIPV